MRHYRINEQKPLKTKQLLLTPMSEAELREQAENSADSLARSAFAEMLRCVIGYPDQALWYTGWRMSLHESGETAGYLCFHGLPEDKTVRLGFEVREQYWGNGYATDAIKSLCDWAFSQENAYFIHVIINEKDAAAIHILEKLKFYQIECAVEGQQFWELERPASAWMAVYLCIGMGLGLALGLSVFGNQAIGTAVGMCAGIALGITLDSQDKTARKREKIYLKIDSKAKNG